MNVRHIIYIVALVVSLLSLGAIVFWYFFRRRYTRERFAFLTFLTIASLALTFVSVLIAGGDIIQLLVSIIYDLIGQSPPIVSPTWSDKILALIAIISLMYLAVTLHKNWKGQISTDEYERSLIGVTPSILSGTVAVIRHIKIKEDFEIYSPNEKRHEEELFIAPEEVKAWHLRVAKLLSLISQQYHIDTTKDWYDEHRTYMSGFGKKKGLLAVLCVDTEPTDDILHNFVSFVENESGSGARLLVAIQAFGVQKSIEFQNHRIELRFESELLDTLIDLESYSRDIKKRFEEDVVAEGYALTLRDLYVANKGFVKVDDEVSINNIEEELINWSGEPGFRHIALLGEYGQGKSVLALKLTYELLLNRRDIGRIPILIELRGRSPRTQTKLGIIAEWAATYGINPKSILVLHEAGRILFIFDAFDEMDLVGESGLRFDNFRRIWEFARDPKSKIMITGRPNFFLDEREKQVSLNEVQRAEQGPYTQAFYLKPFSIDQTRDALRGFVPNIREGMCDFLNSGTASETFIDLVSRPSTLFLAANIWDELSKEQSLDDINSATVIRKFIDHSYERQQAKYPDSFLSINEREYFMVGIAFGMLMETKFANTIENTKLVEIVRRLLDSFPEGLANFEPASEKKRDPLKERLSERTLLFETILTDVISCGILVNDLSRTGCFKFAHKSFFEYLVAFRMVQRWPERHDNRNLIMCKAIAPIGDPYQLNPEMIRFGGELLIALAGKIKDKEEVSIGEACDQLEKIGIKRPITSMLFFMLALNINAMFWPRIAFVRLLRRGYIPILYCYFIEAGVKERDLKRVFGKSLPYVEEVCKHVIVEHTCIV